MRLSSRDAGGRGRLGRQPGLERGAGAVGVHQLAVGLLRAALDGREQPEIDVHRLEGAGIGATTGAQARLTAYPNPSTGATELRFSVPHGDYVSVAVYDAMGREVARPVEHALMDAGRFAIDFDGTQLQAGSYLVELRTSGERVVEKLVVVR